MNKKRAFYLKFNINNNAKKYKIEEIWDNKVYIKMSKTNYLLKLYLLVFWKSYSKKKSL